MAFFGGLADTSNLDNTMGGLRKERIAHRSSEVPSALNASPPSPCLPLNLRLDSSLTVADVHQALAKAVVDRGIECLMAYLRRYQDF